MHQDSYKRGEALLEIMSEKCSVILHQLGKDYGEERAYGRFLDNPRVPFEGNIYQLFVGFMVQKLDFVIRTYHNRHLEYLKSGFNLRTQAQEWSVQCCYKVKLPATDKRSAHEAILNVSYQKKK